MNLFKLRALSIAGFTTICLSFTAYAQWSLNGTTVSWNGYVGIGISAPQAGLHVVTGSTSQTGTASGEIVAGHMTGMNVSIDRFGIMSREGFSSSTLFLNKDRGNVVIGAGRFGVGTANPEAVLHLLSGNQSIRFLTGTNTSGYMADISVNDDGVNFINNSQARGFVFKNARQRLFTISPGGEIGIGTNNPLVALNIVGGNDVSITGITGLVAIGTLTGKNIAFDNDDIMARNNQTASTLFLNKEGGNVNIGPGTLTLGGRAIKPNGGSWEAPSDARLKKNVEVFLDGLDIVTKMQPVKFLYNGLAGLDEEKENIGVIAQDMQKIAPYSVSNFKAKLEATDKDEAELLLYDPSSLPFILVNAIKEQQAMIDQLKRENQELSKEVRKLKGTLEKISQ